jgi:hypothetical protein
VQKLQTTRGISIIIALLKWCFWYLQFGRKFSFELNPKIRKKSCAIKISEFHPNKNFCYVKVGHTKGCKMNQIIVLKTVFINGRNFWDVFRSKFLQWNSVITNSVANEHSVVTNTRLWRTYLLFKWSQVFNIWKWQKTNHFLRISVLARGVAKFPIHSAMHCS